MKTLAHKMPEVCRFLGIIIRMFYAEDHPVPHFHAIYGNFKATINIRTGKIIVGKLPPQQEAFVRAWTALRKKELLANWEASREGIKPNKINPLR